jgi:hypothetical protein
MSMAGMNNLARISMLNTNLVPDEARVKLKKGGGLGSFDEDDEEQVRPRCLCPHACARPFPSAHCGRPVVLARNARVARSCNVQRSVAACLTRAGLRGVGCAGNG